MRHREACGSPEVTQQKNLTERTQTHWGLLRAPKEASFYYIRLPRNTTATVTGKRKTVTKREVSPGYRWLCSCHQKRLSSIALCVAYHFIHSQTCPGRWGNWGQNRLSQLPLNTFSGYFFHPKCLPLLPPAPKLPHFRPLQSALLQEVLPPNFVLPLEESDLRFTVCRPADPQTPSCAWSGRSEHHPYVSHIPWTSREGPGLSEAEPELSPCWGQMLPLPLVHPVGKLLEPSKLQVSHLEMAIIPSS